MSILPRIKKMDDLHGVAVQSSEILRTVQVPNPGAVALRLLC